MMSKPIQIQSKRQTCHCICVDLIAIVIQKSWLVGMIGNEQGNCFQCITHESMVLADLNSWKKLYWYEIGKAVVEKPWGWTELCQPSQRAFIFLFDFMNSEHNENGCYLLNENSAARGNLKFGPWIHKEIFTWFLYMVRKSLHKQF